MEAWPQMDPSARRSLDDLLSRKSDALGRVRSDYFPHHVPRDEEEERKIIGLQVRAYLTYEASSVTVEYLSRKSIQRSVNSQRQMMSCAMIQCVL